MANGTVIAKANTGSGTDAFAVDLISGTNWPYSKIAFGASGSATAVDATNRLPVDIGTVSVSVGNFPATQTVSGSVSVSNFPASQAVTGPLTDTQLRATPVPVSGTVSTGLSQPLTDAQLRATAVPISGTVTANTGLTQPLTDTQLRATAVPVSGSVGITGSVAVTGTFWQATQPVSGTVTANAGTGTFAVSAASLPLPTGAATETTLSTLNTKVPSQGQAAMAASLPVVIASNQSAVPVSGTVATSTAALLTSYNQAGVIAINTVLATLDCSLYRGVSIQCVSMGTSGVVTPEWSNDNTNWQAGTILTAAGVTATTFNGAGLWTAPFQARYLRLRLSTATTAGTTTLSIHQTEDRPQTWLATQPVSGAVTASVGGATLGAPNLVADVASAALTTTTTTAGVAPTSGQSYQVNIPVTAVSGTTPTLDVSIEESDDTGTNWRKIYDFPRITATGMYRSPILPLIGNRVRYVQTVGGTTPSFTRAINRLQIQLPSDAMRQLVDRTVAPNTLNSTTPVLDTRDAGNRVQMVINMGAITTTAPAFQIEGSEDGGTSWFNIGTALTSVANSSVQLTVADFHASQIRARVSTAGVGATLGYVVLKAHD